jgi:hypothetical protein
MSSAAAPNSQPEKALDSIFNTKYDEFVANLRDVFPELGAALDTTASLTATERTAAFKAQVVPSAGNPGRDHAANPGVVLPGVRLTDEMWGSISEGSQKAIQEFLTLLSFTLLLDEGTGAAWGDSKEGFASFMAGMKDKMDGVDFSAFTEKFAKIFGAGAGGLPKIPEKFLKGHIARLAEEIVRDFKPEDFGLDMNEMSKHGDNPSKAFEMLMRVYTTNPGLIQKSIQKISKRLQQKIQSGSIRPQEIIREAEELMKEFSENPAFVDMMSSFGGMFGMGGAEDPDLMHGAMAGAQSTRMSLVRERLRKKVEANKVAAAAAAAGATMPFEMPTTGGGGGGGGAGGPAKKTHQKKRR